MSSIAGKYDITRIRIFCAVEYLLLFLFNVVTCECQKPFITEQQNVCDLVIPSCISANSLYNNKYLASFCIKYVSSLRKCVVKLY